MNSVYCKLKTTTVYKTSKDTSSIQSQTAPVEQQFCTPGCFFNHYTTVARGHCCVQCASVGNNQANPLNCSMSSVHLKCTDLDLLFAWHYSIQPLTFVTQAICSGCSLVLKVVNSDIYLFYFTTRYLKSGTYSVQLHNKNTFLVQQH